MDKTKAHLNAESELPIESREAFNLLVDEYKTAAEQHTGQVWVNYKILSDLIRAGWRKTTWSSN